MGEGIWQNGWQNGGWNLDILMLCWMDGQGRPGNGGAIWCKSTVPLLLPSFAIQQQWPIARCRPVPMNVVLLAVLPAGCLLLLRIVLLPIVWFIRTDVIVTHCKANQVTDVLPMTSQFQKGISISKWHLIVGQSAVLQFVQVGQNPSEFQLKWVMPMPCPYSLS